MPKRTEFRTVTSDTKLLLAGQEGRNVDFKLDPKAIDAEDIVAFANASGGSILAGVDDVTGEDGVQRGKISGCRVDDRTKQSLIGKAISCRPSIDIHIQVENTRTNSPILRIDIPEGIDKPYSTSSGTYKIRSEGRNVGIDPPLLKAIILESEADEFVERFRHAGEDLVRRLALVEQKLSEQILAVQQAAEVANDSAIRAEAAAHEAIDAAYEAAAAAEDVLAAVENAEMWNES